jgi:hypothetical protein
VLRRARRRGIVGAGVADLSSSAGINGLVSDREIAAYSEWGPPRGASEDGSACVAKVPGVRRLSSGTEKSTCPQSSISSLRACLEGVFLEML